MVPNDRWSVDFVSDQLTDGRRFRILTVVDDCRRECLALVAVTSLEGIRVARELERLVTERGKPKMVVSQRQRQRVHQQSHPDPGPIRAASHGITSRRASPYRTPSSRGAAAG